MNSNHTTVSEFLIHGFSSLRGFRIPVFILFLIIYIVTILEHILVILLTATTLHLQSPMYLILKHMSICHIMFTTNLQPIMLRSFLIDNAAIPIFVCFAQINMYSITGNTVSYLHTLMSFDRYMAISNPLRYNNLFSIRNCNRCINGIWTFTIIVTCLGLTSYLQLEFCGPNVIDNFYCDFNPLVDISCSDTTAFRKSTYIVTVLVVSLNFMTGIVTYILIISAILKIPSDSGKTKAFSTCGSHLILIAISFGSIISVYIVPARAKTPDVKKGLSLIFTVVIPFLSPIAYALKNDELHRALQMKTNIVKKLNYF